MSSLTLSLIQTETLWHDAAGNRAHFEERFRALPATGDLVVLPEMFSTGFTMDSVGQAEAPDGPTVDWLREQAAQYRRAFCGSLIVLADGRYTNRFVLVMADGAVHSYDKRHRFRMAGEHEHFAAGQERCVFQLHGVRLCPQVCYDLRFPVFSRNRDDYDLLLYVANWPGARALAWRTLLRARAIENLCYTVGVNRIGIDGNGVSYAGDSSVFGPEGEALAELAAAEAVHTLTLDFAALAATRQRFPAGLDSDRFELDLTGDREAI